MKLEDVKVGMKLRVLRKFPENRHPNWVGAMDKTIGKVGEVIAVYQPVPRYKEAGSVLLKFEETGPHGESWAYMPDVLAPEVELKKEEEAPKAKALHNFKPLDQVVIYRKVNRVCWVDEMDKCVGLRGVVVIGPNIHHTEPFVALENGEKWYVPHTALKRYKV